jgi:sorting nexin-4
LSPTLVLLDPKSLIRPPRPVMSSTDQPNHVEQEDERDFSSSVAWETNPSSSSSSSAPPPPPPSSDPYSAYTHVPTTSNTLNEKRGISNVRVLDGKTELEGTSDMFVSYLVTATVTDLNHFSTTSGGTTTSRRRFQDFVFLRESLKKDFQACVVPPLPSKQRMGTVISLSLPHGVNLTSVRHLRVCRRR